MSIQSNFDPSILPGLPTGGGSLTQKVYGVLKTAILSLAAAPGERLGKPEICAHFNVSRSPVSEAIAKLAAEGLVEVTPQSGSRVRFFSLHEIHEAAFLRAALELAAVEKIATTATEDQLAALSRNLRLQSLLAQDDDSAGLFQADQDFHAMILDFTGFDRLRAMADAASLQLVRARVLLMPLAGRTAETLVEHQEVFDAIRARNPAKARACMARHLDQVEAKILPLVEQRPELFRPI